MNATVKNLVENETRLGQKLINEMISLKNEKGEYAWMSEDIKVSELKKAFQTSEKISTEDRLDKMSKYYNEMRKYMFLRALDASSESEYESYMKKEEMFKEFAMNIQIYF